MGFRRLILGVVFCNMVLSAGANSLMKCDRFCKSAGYHEEVPYPFGFSEGCGIRLNCRDDGDIRIGDFPVMNLTSKTILVSVPGNCSRSVENLRGLNGRNFAVAWWNVILLSNCVKPLTDCAPPASLVNTRFVKGDCDLKSERVSCYSESRGDDDFLDLERLKRRNCSVALSSLAVDFGTGKIPGLSLRFHTAELVWWLEGKCRCHVNAGCVSVRLPDGRYGFRCKCNDGFVGDGFADGDGCRRATSPGPNCNFKNFMQGKCGEKRVIILIGGLAAGACGVVVLLTLLCCCIQRRSAFLKKRYAAMRFLSEAAGGSGVPCIPYKEIERATDGFSEKKMLGSGAYGTVYAAKLRSFGRVAIKKLKCHGPNSVEHVMNEIKLISSVRHPNLVQLIGCCVENDEQILVYEFMPNGTLFQHLHRVQGSGLSWEMRLNIATETARAIAHLHSAMSPPIYHRDIKSSNILLDLNCNSKVADFGLSRFGRADESHISTVPRGTPGYLDPHYHLTDKSDVYSFGVVLVEIITAKKVVDFSRPPSEINLSAVAVDRIAKGLLYEIIDPFLEPHRDTWTLSSIHRVAELAFTCLAFDKDMRPSMIEVVEELEQNRQSGQPPADGILSKVSSRSSSRSSWACGSEKSTRALSNRVLGSRRLILSQRVGSALSTMEVIDDASPVSVHDPWLREESSQSAVTLLDHLARST